VDLDALTGLYERDQTALVRVDFTDDDAWQRLVTLARETSFEDDEDPYVPNIVVIDDRSYDGADAGSIATAARDAHDGLGYVLLADAASMAEAAQGTTATLVYVDLTTPFDDSGQESFGRAFRSVIAEVASIEANLSISNMDFDEFADYADERGGVFRGFEPGD
jgi:hypothetical protein